jgi:hypothetical protein
MCIYGVTKIGEGTIGPSRFLPPLLRVLEISKPSIVFASGCFVVTYLLYRSGYSGPLLKKMFLLLVTIGAISVADASAEGAYLVMPKKEIYPNSGCCVGPSAGIAHRRKETPAGLTSEAQQPWVRVSYYLANGLVVALLLVHFVADSGGSSGKRMLWLLFACAGSLPVNLVFLIDVAAPKILGLPFHHCLYDLPIHAPESLLGAVLTVVGSFSVFWAAVAHWTTGARASAPCVRQLVSKLLFLALFGYVGSVVFFTVEIAVSAI